MRETKYVRAPKDSTLFWIYAFSPSMIEATEMTLVTPITMPRIVSDGTNFVRSQRVQRDQQVFPELQRRSLSSPPAAPPPDPDPDARIAG